ncbi:MAG: methyltransferase [Pseudomonadota bacterium]
MKQENLIGAVIVAAFVITSAVAADDASLVEILASQPDATKARYAARHPQQTLEFFGIKPGMTVVEALPGRGWYTKIIGPVLGPQGRLIGADYAPDMYPLFNLFSEDFITAKKSWTSTWPQTAQGWLGAPGPRIAAFQFGAMPAALAGEADAVLLIRALHNLRRFDAQGGYLSAALGDAYQALKPGGTLGVVQHLAREDASDDWANGSNGYLKKSYVIARIEQAGFQFVSETDINHNPLDQPSEDDFVWRLPPSLASARGNEQARKKYLAIGESHRMTLRFRKPEK